VHGRTVIDVNNLSNTDNTAITITPSGAHALQDLLPGASVVKAFNTVFSSLQANPVVDGVHLDGFYAGDGKKPRGRSALFSLRWAIDRSTRGRSRWRERSRSWAC
jgi:hypothetical protein